MTHTGASRPIGVLALQGDFDAHINMLLGMGVEALPVRTAEELEQVSGLILPGGESTTIGKLMELHNLADPIRQRAQRGMPVFGTCAGMILLAAEIEESNQFRLALLDIAVARNAFGRQIESFEADISLPEIGTEPVRGVFIRAPYVTRAGPAVVELARFRGKIVAVRSGSILATAFHPELTADTRVHAYFVSMVRQAS
ncbi:MAG: pyridoxal 5'-phosphate synthase glutaminase subunit PdxT [Chthonomonadales bacterium]